MLLLLNLPLVDEYPVYSLNSQFAVRKHLRRAVSPAPIAVYQLASGPDTLRLSEVAKGVFLDRTDIFC
jgi:hypothetical protein